MRNDTSISNGGSLHTAISINGSVIHLDPRVDVGLKRVGGIGVGSGSCGAVEVRIVEESGCEWKSSLIRSHSSSDGRSKMIG